MAEKSTKEISKKQEKMVADYLGGYPVGGSGAFAGAPGDVKTWDWLVECKTHMEPNQNIFFDASVWDKIQKEAMGMHKKPVLIVDDGSQNAKKTWCLCKSVNINMVGVIAAQLPMKIRKNITAKHEKLEESLKKSLKGNVVPGTFFEHGCYETVWCGEDVVIMPLSTFKELFEK